MSRNHKVISGKHLHHGVPLYERHILQQHEPRRQDGLNHGWWQVPRRRRERVTRHRYFLPILKPGDRDCALDSYSDRSFGRVESASEEERFQVKGVDLGARVEGREWWSPICGLLLGRRDDFVGRAMREQVDVAGDVDNPGVEELGSCWEKSALPERRNGWELEMGMAECGKLGCGRGGGILRHAVCKSKCNIGKHVRTIVSSIPAALPKGSPGTTVRSSNLA